MRSHGDLAIYASDGWAFNPSLMVFLFLGPSAAASALAGDLARVGVSCAHMSLSAGTRLGPYEILSLLGAGGMGEVYRARHIKLRREAAIKVLPDEFASDAERLQRFEREARAASALNHPAIVTIYDIDEHEGTNYIAMELVEGMTLRKRLAEGRLETEDALGLGLAIAEGLARAHAAGVVHRDLKPENVMIAEDGQVKILDFGLAQQTPTGPGAPTALTTMTRMTRQGAVLGTVSYMSPEQAAGRAVGHCSDQFSFGVVLYEMLCGQLPFQGASVATVLSAILRDVPTPPRKLRPETPKDVEEIVRRCLEKEPGNRYATTLQLSEALRRGAARLSGERSGFRLGRWAILTVLAALLIAGGVIAWLGLRNDVVRWMERETLARIEELTEVGELAEAFRLARGVREKLPDDPEVQRMLERITIPISIATEPPGAEVEVRRYASPDSPWVRLGETPLEGIRVPYALTHWKITRRGFETFEGAPFGARPFIAFAQGVTLDPEGSRPEGMVRVPGGPFNLEGFPPVELGDYWLDRYEVTNRQFKEFIDTGGYERAEYWTEPFAEQEKEIPRADAIARFVDATGRPGPAGWEVGSYAAEEADFPVGGVSWYEASAYCRSVDKHLPTIFHWSAATAQDQLSDIVRVSNFGAAGPAPVGSHPGLGDFGTYDMAGNVKEWCHNEMGRVRYILGGAWGEPSYLFRVGMERSPPFSRELTHGFRCARFKDPPAEELFGPFTPRYAPSATGEAAPVANEIFEAYRRMYAYDPSDLEAKVESVDESSPHWRRETVSFKAAYGGERVLAHLLLPLSTEPPYQAVIWFPGDDVFFFPVGAGLASQYLYDFIPRSGRALIYPVYKGMYERYVPFSFKPNEWRDMMVMWSKDLGRTVDYLEERPDIDAERLAFYGFSGGAIYGPVFTAIDERFKANVLLGGGLLSSATPEMDLVNFAPRSRVPTLMVNGKDDFLATFDRAQDPLFRLLGAPEDEKRHARIEGGHIPSDRLAIIEEVLAWLDRFLGPVAETGSGSTSG